MSGISYERFDYNVGAYEGPYAVTVWEPPGTPGAKVAVSASLDHEFQPGSGIVLVLDDTGTVRAHMSYVNSPAGQPVAFSVYVAFWSP